jgi:hypothetical protein
MRARPPGVMGPVPPSGAGGLMATLGVVRLNSTWSAWTDGLGSSAGHTPDRRENTPPPRTSASAAEGFVVGDVVVVVVAFTPTPSRHPPTPPVIYDI